jgi:hypothetical protein
MKVEGESFDPTIKVEDGVMDPTLTLPLSGKSEFPTPNQDTFGYTPSDYEQMDPAARQHLEFATMQTTDQPTGYA